MAADYAGAIAAIKAYFVANWQTDGVPTTAFGFVNEAACKTVDENGAPTVWALFEVLGSGTVLQGSGTPGNQIIIFDGLVKVHVFVPTGVGTGEGDGGGMQKALAAGEIFRNRIFYDTVTDGCYVRSGFARDGQPRFSQGDVSSNDGEWFVTTATIPFEYRHRG